MGFQEVIRVPGVMLYTWYSNCLGVTTRLKFRRNSKNIKKEVILAAKARGTTKMLQYRAGQERFTRLAPAMSQKKAKTQQT